jgi:hypothetical protein
MKTKLESDTGSNPPACSRSSGTPETDAVWSATAQIDGIEAARMLRFHGEEMERQRDNLAKKFTRLDKPKYSGDPMLDAVLADTNPDFRAWVDSLPPTYWARYDLSAARIGWEAARKFISENVKEHAPLSAAASVDYGVGVETTVEHVNRAADRGCVSRLVRCSSSSVDDVSGGECSSVADKHESAPPQECPGHPEAKPPAHGRGWPPTAMPDPISRASEIDS